MKKGLTDNEHTISNKLLQHVGQGIRAARSAKNISQLKLATILGIQKASLSRIEAGKINIKVYSLHRIAEGLHMPAAQIWIKPHPKQPPSYEEILVLQAKYRRLTAQLSNVSADLKEILAAIRNTNDFKMRMGLHEIAKENFEKRRLLLSEMEKITKAIHGGTIY